MRLGDRRSNRIDPAMLDAYHPDHRARYEFAAQQLQGGTALDAGCGFGYGSAILASNAEHVVGIDIYPEAIDYAAGEYANAQIRFEVADVRTWAPPEAPFDAIVCLETVEHVDQDTRFICALRELLKPGGVLVISTPNQPVNSPSGAPSDPTHIREYDAHGFEQLLIRGGFAQVDMRGLHLSREIFDRHRTRSWLGRLDKCGIRRLIPRQTKAAIVARLAPVRDGLTTVSCSVGEAHGLIAIARR